MTGSALRSREYESAGEYTIKVSGSATRIAFWPGTPALLQDIVSKLDDGVTGITSAYEMFRNASEITQFSQSDWFDAASSNVTDMFRMFQGAGSFNQDISAWDVSNVQNMRQLFTHSPFNQDIGDWDVSNVTTMERMFYDASEFDQDISRWNVSNVENFTSFLNNGELSPVNYSWLLIRWSRRSLQTGLNVDFGNSQYDLGAPADARDLLMDDVENDGFDWTISDGGDTGNVFRPTGGDNNQNFLVNINPGEHKSMTKERNHATTQNQETTIPAMRHAPRATRHTIPATRPAFSRSLIALTFALAGFAHGMAARGGEGEVRLAENGKARAVIVAPADVMEWEEAAINRRTPHMIRLAERRRQMQRDSVVDLAHYLGRISGTTLEITDTLSADDDRIPIYIAGAAEDVFGPVGISKAGQFGFRVVVDGRRGVGLYGESEYGTSYAIYELLHRLGCRWFMPSSLGEVIPETATLTVDVMDERLAPATEWRNIQGRTADSDFLRRNRLGGNYVEQRHILGSYITQEQRDANPEWRLHIDGRPQRRGYRWTREDVAHAVADRIIERLDNDYQPSISLSPEDRVVPTEDPEEMKHDPEPRVWEPAAGRWSVTDRLLMLANRVAERVGEKYPDVIYGMLAYVNFNMPPAREPVHPNIIPVIAPIDFNRHHPMTWEDHPNEFWLKDMVEGWGEVADRVAYYAYGMNLAEITAPNPFITKWGTDIPIILENNCVFWCPETMGGWESMLPGFYLSIRMTFYPDEKPEDILQELWTRFYGAAAEPMAAYWHHIDRAWVETREYAGSGFGYLRMFTPEVMAEARELIDRALAKCETIEEYRRVKIIDKSLALFELFMKMREDFAEANFRTIETDRQEWRGTLAHLRNRYREQYCFDTPRHGNAGIGRFYFDYQWGNAYKEASRMNDTYARHGAPMLEWQWKHNPDEEEVSRPWVAPDYDAGDWPEKHVVRDTWSSIGHHNSLTDEPSGRSGRMVYRASQRLRALPEDKRAYLWIGSTDGSAKVYVNGEHVSYIVPDGQRHAGEVRDRFTGYCRPAKFDVTDLLVNGDNHFAIKAERLRLNELGTGGLMGPVMIYRER